jgi:hypothetical protein
MAWRKGYCYEWSGSQWVELDPKLHSDKYMIALFDLLENAPNGAFNNLFCMNLIAQQAFVKYLQVLEITLSELVNGEETQRGSIKSQNYSPGVSGFKIEYNGNSEFNNAVIKIGDSSQYIIIDGVDKSIRSSNFVAGVSGWKLYRNGDVEFSNGTFRGSLIIGGTWSDGGLPISTSRSPGINANKSWTSLVETYLYGSVNVGFPYPGTPEPSINFRGTRTAYKDHKSYFKTDRYIHGRYTITQLKTKLDEFNIPLGKDEFLPVTGTIVKEVVVGTQSGTTTRYDTLILSFMNTWPAGVYQFVGINTYSNAGDTCDVSSGTNYVTCSFAFV